MSQFYEDMAATAAEMIAEYGQAVVLTHSTPGGYDTATGKSSPPATITVHCSGIERAYKASEVDGTLIRQGDKRLVVSPLDAAGAVLDEPRSNARATLADGSVWTVLGVEPIRPGGLPIIYIVQLRS